MSGDMRNKKGKGSSLNLKERFWKLD